MPVQFLCSDRGPSASRKLCCRRVLSVSGRGVRVLAWETLYLYNEPRSMLSIQLILNISNQWSIRTSFISENENDRKEASFAQ